MNTELWNQNGMKLMNKNLYNKSIKKHIKKKALEKINDLNDDLNASGLVNNDLQKRLLHYENLLFWSGVNKTGSNKCIPHI